MEEDPNNDVLIEVRTIAGDSTTVTISPNDTIAQLKLLLKFTFPPASSFPDFHLFYKGSKLMLQSKICSLAIENDIFMLLVPFTKKNPHPLNPRPEFSSNASNEKPLSDFAESAYAAMKKELSSLRDDSNSNEELPDFCLKGKRKRDADKATEEGCLYEFVLDLFSSKNWNLLIEENSVKLVEVLNSVNCLGYPYSGNCLFVQEADLRIFEIEKPNDSGKLCLCPSWLKKIMEAFTFLNIRFTFLQLEGGVIVSSRLMDELKQLRKFGVRVEFEDMENISVLCPKVLSFADSVTKFTNSSNMIVIMTSAIPTEDRHKKGEKYKFAKVLAGMKKREDIFKSNMRRWLMKKSGNAMPHTLEDLLKISRQSGSSLSINETKRTKRPEASASTTHSVKKRCHETNKLLPAEMVEHLREGFGSRGQIVHVEDIGARKAIHVDFPVELSYNTKSALKSLGIPKLYSHQAESIVASLTGKNVVVATMTSSGKSLCYNLPVLEALCENSTSTALYLFPTKALAQDQLRALLTMTKDFDLSIDMGIYDGDTSWTDRTLLRDKARLLITNPDMLHMSILPIHGQFSRILSNLRFVVIDEAHYYKGAFGCHTALILRRLRRLCSHVYGSDPSFVFSTATSANPKEHCMELANLSTLELIDNDGSPSSQKLFVLWNPNIAENNGETARRAFSPITEASHLFAEMVQHGLRCIVFCGSRKLCELVLCYTREILLETAPHLVDAIWSYRGGYVAQDRRKIEKDFFSGKLSGIAATNALELGIDVGHIDVTLHLGFPGSIASLWQQAGRSGRRERPSLAVYIAFEGPLDQYFMRFPAKLFRSPIECCHIDAQNQQVLQQHLTCAALEHPISLVHDEKYFGCGLETAITSLKNRGCVTSDVSCKISARMWTYIGPEKRPSRGISIRAIEAEKYKVLDGKENEVIIEEIEESRAFFQVYEGAVYLHQGKTYLVEELNIPGKTAVCKEADLKYYTKTRDFTDIHVIGGSIAYPARVFDRISSRTTAQANICKVTTTWFGFHKICRGSNEVFDSVDLSLPQYSYESQAVWIPVPQAIKAAVMEQNFSFRGGLHAASHALLNVVPLYIRCNYADLSPECPNPRDNRYFPERILLYDQHPGGTGISMQIQPYFNELLVSALELLESCRCSGGSGCPSCVQSMICHEYNETLHKEAAIMIIKGVLDTEKSYFAASVAPEVIVIDESMAPEVIVID